MNKPLSLSFRRVIKSLEHSDDPDLLLRKAVTSALISFEVDTESGVDDLTPRDMRRRAFSAGVRSVKDYIDA